MIIAIANDHGGTELKHFLLQQMQKQEGLKIIDLGINDLHSVDYPEYAGRVCQALRAGEAERGILICGTGLGMSMAANRYPGIRAALCHDEFTARLSRQHNDANILVLGGRVTGAPVAEAIVQVWLATAFEGGRHQRRIQLMDK
ncbi:ribose 5-phosphate isomerase B [Candidatus Magnetaquicoccus inordinatus]|uniref:ribose 5-phosphate isomerase B n=1 Tax=Candidatus Magnetaquicoccus inordinatus TaxID=2496818 RepID=UPI00102B3616|nr:ribose 5-phosphate isomerase B [Candidatus Magnetaquicoccus inordinatus]